MSQINKPLATECSIITGNSPARGYGTSGENSDWPERFSPACAEVEQRLLAAGITPPVLMDAWGVTLWSIRVKEHKIKLKMEAHRTVDESALRQWFTGILGTQRELSIKFSPASKCCLSPCEGCLMGNASKRAQWVTPYAARCCSSEPAPNPAAEREE